MTKLTLAGIIITITVALAGFPYSTSIMPVNTIVSIKTDKASYEMGSIVEISGSVTNPPSDELFLKIFNSKAELVWLHQVRLNEDNTFRATLLISDPIWNTSTFYVLTAKAGETIGATSFEITPNSSPQETTTSIVTTTFDKFLQNIFFLPIIGIIIIGTTVYILYSRRVQKNIASLKQSLPLITFDPPSPAKVHLSRGASMSYEVWDKISEDQKPKIDSVEFWIAIKNIGGNTAKNITPIFFQKDEMFSRQDMKIEEERKTLDKQVPLPALGPGEFYYWDFEIPWYRFVKLEKDNLFVGLLISHDKHKTRSSSSIIFGIGKGGNYIVDEWFSH